MFNRLKMALSLSTLLALIVGFICFCVILALIAIIPREIDPGRSLPLVNATVAKLTSLHPSSLQDPDFRLALEDALKAPHINTLWLIGPDGRIVWAQGSTASSTPIGSTVEELAIEDTKSILDALPEGTLNENNRMQLLAASAIRREGNHNDVYRHLIRPLQLSQNNQTALLGVSYSACFGGAELVHVIVGLAALLGGLISFIIYWLSLPLWVFFDAKEHGDRAPIWAAFVLIGNVVALMAYILTRPPRLVSSPLPIRGDK